MDVADPCLSCRLPECDDTHPDCAWAQSPAAMTADQRYRANPKNRLQVIVSCILKAREKRIGRVLEAIREAA